ncbi:alpha/beta hydrolase [Paractinoplanes deccanensis]|uniref:Alpha/beta hydrolase n=1 Tax=Paractinoplanes deccanensis TaxID=113561 RepID=A0ABQ3Y762_9ACTN|nr:alpha/beta hydrolase [Actinoplanes deccanensis]GID75836.1 alpha/beta hydrolase [Actinoplanes deccanensis]
MRTPINVSTWDGPAHRDPAILIHGTFTWAAHAFERQRPLARTRRILLPDRRGFGDSPDLGSAPTDGDPAGRGHHRGGGGVTSDYEVDAEDIVALMGSGAHLVGHSYGGTVAMLAAAARPGLVRSLTLIEPCAHQLAAGEPVVAAAIEDGRRFMAGARRGTPEEYVATAYRDAPTPEPADRLLRAARTALGERPCWLAELAVTPLAQAAFPKLVIVGGWERVPPGFRPGMAAVMRAVASTVADKIGARLVRVTGAAHDPHRDQPATVNALLEALWSTEQETPCPSPAA